MVVLRPAILADEAMLRAYDERPTLGAVLHGLRAIARRSLKKTSADTGIQITKLHHVEHDRALIRIADFDKLIAYLEPRANIPSLVNLARELYRDARAKHIERSL